jgi:hypothetical protein
MGEAPVRLVLGDDLVRGRGSVFFRFWFALPFLLWLALWAIAAFFATIGNWFATLASGRSPDVFHGFLARFVRYAVHVYAYLYLSAERMPNFDGRPGYAVDVEIGPPLRQNRWTVAFRIVLVLPALILVGVLAGAGEGFGSENNSGLFLAGLLPTTAFLGWFACLARARMPRGLRDAGAYGLAYAAHTWAYLLLLTDRYPTSDPFLALPELPERSDPITLEVGDDLRRSRLTVFFRVLLAAPHFVWLALWGVASIPAAILNWFWLFFAGVSPAWLHRFLAGYVRYQLHVNAFVFLIGNPFPGFTGAEGRYPLDPHVAGPARMQPLSVIFRLPAAVPALILTAVYGWLLLTAGVLGWFASLATGRMPQGLRNAGALALRYAAQTYGYVLLVSPAYPYSGPCHERRPQPGDASALVG